MGSRGPMSSGKTNARVSWNVAVKSMCGDAIIVWALDTVHTMSTKCCH